MACGCKKKQTNQEAVQTPPPMTINVTLAEQESSQLTKTQESLVNQIVDKLNKINENNTEQ
jgi:hypothetical protein